MATSENDIANKALRHLGVTQTVSDFRAQTSKEAKAILAAYDDVIETVLRDAPWPFATRMVDLVETLDTSSEYEFVYAYPADCVTFRRIVSGLRPDTKQSQVKYRIISTATSKVILTDWPDAEAEITYREIDVSRWNGDFADAVSFYLAGMIAPSLLRADTFKLAERAMTLYDWRVQKAAANAFNEEARDEDPPSELERARS